MYSKIYRVLTLFGGLGGKTLGFQQASTHLLETSARFQSIGGIEIDPEACEDFRKITGSPAMCADIHMLTPADVCAFFGDLAPDVVCMSPPCTSVSGLTTDASADSPEGKRLRELIYKGVELVLATWPKNPPKLILLENVPGITGKRGKEYLARARKCLRAHGYAISEKSHDCGVLGGLAQHRRRFLLVARHKESVKELLYNPPKKRVLGCGEVLCELPLPGTPSAGVMHRLPEISELNWRRLAYIPPGGDHRNLPKGVRPQPNNPALYAHKYVVLGWQHPANTVTGETRLGSGGASVADPGIAARFGFTNQLAVMDWGSPSRAITGAVNVGGGALSVGDGRFNNCFSVFGWDAPINAANGGTGPTSGAASVADLRLNKAFDGTYGVTPWDHPARAIIGGPNNGGNFVADPSLPELSAKRLYGNNWKVIGWGMPANAVIGQQDLQVGAQSVGDVRIRSTYGHALHLTAWDSAMGAITAARSPQNGGGAVADLRVEGTTQAGPYGVTSWFAPMGTITGEAYPTTGVFSVADLRVMKSPFAGAYGLLGWDQPSAAVTGRAASTTGAFSLADVRITRDEAYRNAYGVLGWDDPLLAITGRSASTTGRFSLADIRLDETPRNPDVYGVLGWDQPCMTVTASSWVGCGSFSVADLRLIETPNNPYVYGVMGWMQAARAITGTTSVGCGTYAIGDVRLTCSVRNGSYGVMSWTEPSFTVVGAGQIDNGPWSVDDPRLGDADGASEADAPVVATHGVRLRPPIVRGSFKPPRNGKKKRYSKRKPNPNFGMGHWCWSDPRVPGNPSLVVRWRQDDPKKAPPFVPVYPTVDNTWHRPLTTAELARLQGLPVRLNGEVLKLAGNASTNWRKRIGNMVPVGTAMAIAEQMLRTLLANDLGFFLMSTEGVWVKGHRMSKRHLRKLAMSGLSPRHIPAENAWASQGLVYTECATIQ